MLLSFISRIPTSLQDLYDRYPVNNICIVFRIFNGNFKTGQRITTRFKASLFGNDTAISLNWNASQFIDFFDILNYFGNKSGRKV